MRRGRDHLSANVFMDDYCLLVHIHDLDINERFRRRVGVRCVDGKNLSTRFIDSSLVGTNFSEKSGQECKGNATSELHCRIGADVVRIGPSSSLYERIVVLTKLTN